MNLKHLKHAYFIGIGGIGMSAIARYFNSIGMEVVGYDKTANPFTKQLESEGIAIHYEDNKKHIPNFVNSEEAIVIYTPAIPKDNKILDFIVSNKIELFKRAQVLGLISKNSYTLAVAGTHGKTTTSSLVAHILNENNINFTAFLGGISTNLKSNYIHKTDGIQLFDKTIMVVEADEYDRSFLQLQPDVAIVTSTDADHLDIYGEANKVKESFQDFVNLINKNGVAILNEKTDLTANCEQINYGFDKENEAFAADVKIVDFQFGFDFCFEDKRTHVINGLPGFHNIENATSAIVMCQKIGLSLEKIANSCKTFLGVKRRFEYIVNKEYIVIDDYAHHPTELESFIKSVKELYPKKQITGIFQPHLFSRTRDFADDFASALDMLDNCWLMDIYPAREQPIEGINAEFLAFKMNKTPLITVGVNILKHLKERKPEVLLIMGAGDIDQLIQPIREIYNA